MMSTRLSLLTATLFFAIAASGGAWGQDRIIINGDAEFGWRVEDNKRVTTGAGTAVLKDNQLQNVVPGNVGNVDARSYDVSRPVVGAVGGAVGTNLVGTPGVGVTDAIGARGANIVPPIIIPVLPVLPVIK